MHEHPLDRAHTYLAQQHPELSYEEIEDMVMEDRDVLMAGHE